MSSLSTLYIKKETLETLLKVVNAKKEKGVEITVSISDDVNKFDQNLTSYVSQSKEQRDAKKEKFYVGNGRVFWTDGKITKAEKKEQIQDVNQIDDAPKNDLPF